MNEITLKAYAKINIGLDVLRKRNDGYHEVKMIMQTINLYDTLSIRRTTNKQPIQLKTNLPFLPTNGNNLVVKAAKLLMEEFNITDSVQIQLEKHIPVAAGLAGGSSDAAATLYGINQLFRLGLTQHKLMEYGVTLGADVPYCLLRGTALSEGIGEKLSPLPPLPTCYILVVKPNISVSTKFVYENLRLDEEISHPDIDAILSGIKQDNLYEVTSHLGNILETVTIPAHPSIKKIKEQMVSLGSISSLMSGSGPTVFGIFDYYDTAKHAYDYFKRSEYARQTYLTLPYQPRR